MRAQVKEINRETYREMLASAPAIQPGYAVVPDWIEWQGGDCPVAPTALVLYELRDGSVEQTPIQANQLRWSNLGLDYDIVKYRLASAPAIQPQAAERVDEQGDIEKLMVELLSLGSSADRASSYEETCAIDDRIGYVKAQIRMMLATPADSKEGEK